MKVVNIKLVSCYFIILTHHTSSLDLISNAMSMLNVHHHAGCLQDRGCSQVLPLLILYKMYITPPFYLHTHKHSKSMTFFPFWKIFFNQRKSHHHFLLGLHAHKNYKIGLWSNHFWIKKCNNFLTFSIKFPPLSVISMLNMQEKVAKIVSNS